MHEEECEPKVFVVERKCEEKGMRVTSFDKWLISAIIAVVFFIFCLPALFKITNSATSMVGLNTINQQGNPSYFGLTLHAIIFLVVVRLLMQ